MTGWSKNEFFLLISNAQALESHLSREVCLAGEHQHQPEQHQCNYNEHAQQAAALQSKQTIHQRQPCVSSCLGIETNKCPDLPRHQLEARLQQTSNRPDKSLRDLGRNAILNISCHQQSARGLSARQTPGLLNAMSVAWVLTTPLSPSSSSFEIASSRFCLFSFSASAAFSVSSSSSSSCAQQNRYLKHRCCVLVQKCWGVSPLVASCFASTKFGRKRTICRPGLLLL